MKNDSVRHIRSGPIRFPQHQWNQHEATFQPVFSQSAAPEASRLPPSAGREVKLPALLIALLLWFFKVQPAASVFPPSLPGDATPPLTFSVQLFSSLTQTLRSVAKVENSRCCSHRGRCQGPTGRILLLLPLRSPSHGWRRRGWAGGQGGQGGQGLALKWDPLATAAAGRALAVPA